MHPHLRGQRDHVFFDEGLFSSEGAGIKTAANVRLSRQLRNTLRAEFATFLGHPSR